MSATTDVTAPAGPAAGRDDWVRVCRLDHLVPDRGDAALVDGQQIALFRLAHVADRVYAVAHHDPFSRANVIARGIVGTVGDLAVVISPMHKQKFDLVTGVCVDDPAVILPVWETRVVDGWVEIGRAPRSSVGTPERMDR